MSKSRKRHALGTRIWHWLNLLAVSVMFMSGLGISNAHRHLYWGEWGFIPGEAWYDPPHYPGWATLPGYYNLAGSRDWHVVFAWVLALSLLGFMLSALLNRHFRRDLTITRDEIRPRNVWQDILAHLRLDFAHGAGKYNLLQKLAYGYVLFIALPLMIFTGMDMSPGMEAAWPWLTEFFGGRQSARSIHFLIAWSLFAFFCVHVALVLLSGPIGQIRAMITGGRDEEA